MLIIISDIHLGDGTCGKSISASAFRLFSDRLRELAISASWRSGGTYQPITEIDILMLGDILDPLHSTLWLEKNSDESGYVRPWTDYQAPEYAAKLQEITRAILKNNAGSTGFLKNLARKGLKISPRARNGQPGLKFCTPKMVKVRLHYMIGNHDWYYHLPGPAFDSIRQEIIDAFGLDNSSNPFPHEQSESGKLQMLLYQYQVYAQHGDIYDPFNFDKVKGRNAATLGDAFAIEIINRFPIEMERRFGKELPPETSKNLSELVNIRPALATSLWISSQLRQNNVSQAMQLKLKNLWDEISEEFLALPFVRAADRKFKLDLVDGLKVIIKITDSISFKTLDDIVVWIRKRFGSEDITLSHHAMKEEAFLDHKAQFIVYGHTHHHEIVPLDSFQSVPRPTNQMYINSGTWHPYYDLAVHKPEEQKFIPYQVLTYLAFFKDDERGGRHFETWSGAFSD